MDGLYEPPATLALLPESAVRIFLTLALGGAGTLIGWRATEHALSPLLSPPHDHASGRTNHWAAALPISTKFGTSASALIE
jgi:hypothetical protein